MKPMVDWWPSCVLPMAVVLFGLKLQETKCGLSNRQHQYYDLFGSKTNYYNTRRFLRYTNETQLPNSFDDESLEDEHQDLVGEHCSPRVLYFIGRYSARLPDGKDIEMYNRELKLLISKLKLINRCPNRLQRSIMNWISLMDARQANLITELGSREARGLAKRLKRLYPEFFDVIKSRLTIGVTSTMRSAQTAAQFLQEIEGHHELQTLCKPLPTNDIHRVDYNLDRILQSKCYKSLNANYRSNLLDFRINCSRIRANKTTTIKGGPVDGTEAKQAMESIACKVANRLKPADGSKPFAINKSTLNAIYNMCKYENAIQGVSIWCGLLDLNDIQTLEYIEDAKGYLVDAYGQEAKREQSCPLIKGMLETFHKQVSSNGQSQREAFYYFTHTKAIKKILATFGLFRDDKSFTKSKIIESLKRLQAPMERQWRSSLLTPFSSNMILTLYRCQGPNKPVEFRILTALNEQTVQLKGCDDEDCRVENFFGAYDKFGNCDLNRICSPNEQSVNT